MDMRALPAAVMYANDMRLGAGTWLAVSDGVFNGFIAGPVRAGAVCHRQERPTRWWSGEGGGRRYRTPPPAESPPSDDLP